MLHRRVAVRPAVGRLSTRSPRTPSPGPSRWRPQLRSGKSNTVSADAAPWIRQKTSSGDTIIGARAILNQGLEMADAVFFILDPQGNIVERKDAARAYLRDGYWELQDVKTLPGRHHHAAATAIVCRPI